jgi:hypothetical protein
MEEVVFNIPSPFCQKQIRLWLRSSPQRYEPYGTYQRGEEKSPLSPKGRELE